MSTIKPNNLPEYSAIPTLTDTLQAAVSARRFCLQAEEALTRAGLYAVAHAFRFTAAQEKEHAAVLLGLVQHFGLPIPPEQALPPLPQEPAALLEKAADRERVCAEELFPGCAQEAKAAGYPRAAAALRSIARTEQLHARRFRQYLSALQDGTLLCSPVRTSWVCLKCGCLHHGHSAPERCDGCSADHGCFIRSDFHPFAVR